MAVIGRCELSSIQRSLTLEHPSSHLHDAQCECHLRSLIIRSLLTQLYAQIVVSLATVSLISVFIDPSVTFPCMTCYYSTTHHGIYSITVIVISRFLLALHSANLQSTDEGMSECQDGGGTLRFASEFVESMGGPVTSTVREPEPEVLEGTVLPGIDEETGQTYS